jgi:hypothetical protein
VRNGDNQKPLRMNDAEGAFERTAHEKGWKVTKKGWPDFLCRHPDGTVIAVEIKPRTKDGTRLQILKREQADTMDWLTSIGVRCFVSDGRTLESYHRDIHAPEHRRYSRNRGSK